MANFSALKQAIQTYIKQNGNKEITGNILQTILLSMVTTMGDGAINDNASDISDIKVDIQELALGVVYDVSAKNPTAGPNNDGKWESLSALLSDANLNTLIPTSVRKGGMSIMFVQSPDNKYVQYRLMADAWSTVVTDWQGVDDEPTLGSKNIAESGGIEKKYRKTNSIITGDGKIVFVDVNGYIGAIFDSNGLGINDVLIGNQLSVDSFFSAITTLLNTDALYAGYATPSTTPAALTGQKVFYLATQAGTYTNFHFNGGNDPIVLVKDGIYFIVSGNDDDDWNAEPMLQLDDVPTASSNNAVKSGGIEKKYRKTNSIITGDGKIVFVDVNGYIGAIFDSNGLGINDVLIGNNSIKELSQTIRMEADGYLFITDENGYIAVRLDKEGNILSNDTHHEESEYAGKLELPNKINILQGTIESLYYEQMLGNGFLRDYVLLGQSLPYIPQTDRMFINTNAVGLIVRSINLFNGFGERIEQKDININIVDKTVSGSVKICVIGDSMTENPKKLYELANLASKDNNFDITFLGARNATGTDSEGNTRTVKHCGYSGKNIIDVCRLESYGAGLPNIFYDSTLQTTNKFSIAKGIEAMGDIPDVIIIDHGANQSGSAWSDVRGCYDFIISDIATYNIAHNTDIKIVICVQQPGGLSQVVANYSIPSKWSRNWSPTKLMDYVEEYDNRENEGIFLLPQYLIIDPYKDYPRADVPYSSRNTSLREVALDNVHMGINMNGYDSNHVYSYGEICTDGNQNGYVSLKNNNTEPLSDNKTDWAKTKDDVNAGYWKLADAYFAELKYIKFINI